MAFTYQLMLGFEGADFLADGQVFPNTGTYVVGRYGGYAFRSSGSSMGDSFYSNIGPGGDVYVRVAARANGVTDVPAGEFGQPLIHLAADYQVYLTVREDGTLAVFTLVSYHPNRLVWSSPYAVPLDGTWFDVILRAGIEERGNILFWGVRGMGNEHTGEHVLSKSGDTGRPLVSSVNVRYAHWGGAGVSPFDLDDVIAGNGTFAGNEWPQFGRVVDLLPVSDNNRGTWTAGTAGTTNLWEAINNVPPAGLANGSMTTTSQIRSSANNNDIATFNMQTLAAAGIMGIPLAAQAIALAGGSGGSPTGGVYATTPTIAEVQSTWVGEVGTHPNGGWGYKATDIVTNPTLPAATVPVVGVARRVSTTTRNHVEYLALRVDTSTTQTNALSAPEVADARPPFHLPGSGRGGGGDRQHPDRPRDRDRRDDRAGLPEREGGVPVPADVDERHAADGAVPGPRAGRFLRRLVGRA